MSRRKNKKPVQKPKKPSVTFPPRFSVGNLVRVKPGTTVPGFEDIPLGGWAGTIGEVDPRSNPPTYSVEWNQYTLDQMHPAYRKRSERDDLLLESIWLGETDLELDSGEPQIIEQPKQIISRPLSRNDQEDRIRAIFGLTSDDPLPRTNRENLRRYADFLKAQLSFPFKAKYFVETGPFQQTQHTITVVGLLDGDDCDEEDGLLCEIAERSEFIELPLADLEVRRDRHNRQLIEDYSFWFENWPCEEFTTSLVVHPLSGDRATTSEDVDPLPFDDGINPKSLLRTLAECGLCGAVYGGVMGSLLGALDGTIIGALVGGAILGLIGWAIGSSSGQEADATNGTRNGSLIGGTFSLLLGLLMGSLLGAMMVAFIGSLLGGIVGRVVGGLLAKWKANWISPFGGMVFGAGAGAVVLAGYRDQEAALLWGLHGLWVGGITAVFLLSGFTGFLAMVSWARRMHVEARP